MHDLVPWTRLPVGILAREPHVPSTSAHFPPRQPKMNIKLRTLLPLASDRVISSCYCGGVLPNAVAPRSTPGIVSTGCHVAQPGNEPQFVSCSFVGRRCLTQYLITIFPRRRRCSGSRSPAPGALSSKGLCPQSVHLRISCCYPLRRKSSPDFAQTSFHLY